MLAPTVRVGCAEQHMDRAGTMTLRAATLDDFAIELAPPSPSRTSNTRFSRAWAVWAALASAILGFLASIVAYAVSPRPEDRGVPT